MTGTTPQTAEQMVGQVVKFTVEGAAWGGTFTGLVERAFKNGKLQVRVPGLGWRRLHVSVDEIEAVEQPVSVSDVALSGVKERAQPQRKRRR